MVYVASLFPRVSEIALVLRRGGIGGNGIKLRGGLEMNILFQEIPLQLIQF